MRCRPRRTTSRPVEPVPDLGARAYPVNVEHSPLGEVIGAFGWFEGVEAAADGVAEVVDAARAVATEQCLQLGEDLRDRIEIGALGRQVGELGALGLDGFAAAGDLVGGEVVHDDDVAGGERRREGLLDPSAEARTVDRAVEEARRGEAGVAPSVGDVVPVVLGGQRRLCSLVHLRAGGCEAA